MPSDHTTPSRLLRVKQPHLEDVQSTTTIGSPDSADSKDSAGDSPESIKSQLEDALAQLEVARHQRTEVSAELFKFRNLVDELKAQKAQLQTEMNRRLQTHKDDVERIQGMQRELDRMRHQYTEKESEIIELSTRIQELMAKLDSTEQHRELKEENELLWRKVDELKRSEAAELGEGSARAQADRWRSRYNELEVAIQEAFESRRALIGDPPNEDEATCQVLLMKVLESEESLRKSLSNQVSSLRIELRTAKDTIEDLSRQVAETEVSTVKMSMELKRQMEASNKIASLEAERDAQEKTILHLKGELDTVKQELTQSRALASLAESKAAAALDELKLVEASSSTSRELEELKRSIDLKTSDLRAAERSLKNLRAELEVERSKTERLEGELATNSEEGLQLQKKLIETESELRQAKRAVAAAKKEEESLKAVISELEENLAAAAPDTSRSEIELEALRAQLSAAEKRLEVDREDFKDSQNEWWRTEADLKAQIEKLTAQLKVSEDLDKESALIEEYKSRVECLHDELVAKQSSYDRLLEEIQTQKDEIGELRAHLAEVEQSPTHREDRVTQLEAELAERTQQLTNAEERVQELEQRLTQALDQAKQDADGLEERVQNLQQQIDHLTQTATDEKTRREKEVAELREERNEIERRLTSRISELEAHLTEVLDGPAVSTLLAETTKELTVEEQMIKLKSALNTAIAGQKEQSALVELQMSRAAEAEQECKALRAQIKRVEEGWKSEYEGYLANLTRVTNALDKTVAEKKELENEINRLSRVTSPSPRGLRNSPGSSPALTEETSGSTSAESWSKEKRALEKTVEDLRKRAAKLQEECQTAKVKRSELENSMRMKVRADLAREAEWRKWSAVVVGGVSCWVTFLLGAISH